MRRKRIKNRRPRRPYALERERRDGAARVPLKCVGAALSRGFMPRPTAKGFPRVRYKPFLCSKIATSVRAPSFVVRARVRLRRSARGRQFLITFFFTIFANRGTLEGHRTPWADFILLGFANRQVSVRYGLRPYCSKVVAT